MNSFSNKKYPLNQFSTNDNTLTSRPFYAYRKKQGFYTGRSKALDAGDERIKTKI
jgi:hypothetical protein